MLIAAGSDAVRQNKAFRSFLASMPSPGGRPAIRPHPPQPDAPPAPAAPPAEPRMQPRPNPSDLISSISGASPSR